MSTTSNLQIKTKFHRIKRVKLLMKKLFLKKKGFNSKRQEKKLQSISIRLASPERIKQWSERKIPSGEIIGEVTNPETVNYKTLKPKKGGLFCERIFGPIRSFRCACGKAREKKGPFICPECGVAFISSQSRRYKMGYIQLATPIAHIWYLENYPSYLSLLLGIPRKKLERVVYCSDFYSPNRKSFQHDLTFENVWPLLKTNFFFLKQGVIQKDKVFFNIDWIYFLLEGSYFTTPKENNSNLLFFSSALTFVSSSSLEKKRADQQIVKQTKASNKSKSTFQLKKQKFKEIYQLSSQCKTRNFPFLLIEKDKKLQKLFFSSLEILETRNKLMKKSSLFPTSSVFTDFSGGTMISSQGKLKPFLFPNLFGFDKTSFQRKRLLNLLDNGEINGFKKRNLLNFQENFIFEDFFLSFINLHFYDFDSGQKRIKSNFYSIVSSEKRKENAGKRFQPMFLKDKDLTEFNRNLSAPSESLLLAFRDEIAQPFPPILTSSQTTFGVFDQNKKVFLSFLTFQKFLKRKRNPISEFKAFFCLSRNDQEFPLPSFKFPSIEDSMTRSDFLEKKDSNFRNEIHDRGTSFFYLSILKFFLKSLIILIQDQKKENYQKKKELPVFENFEKFSNESILHKIENQLPKIKKQIRFQHQLSKTKKQIRLKYQLPKIKQQTKFPYQLFPIKKNRAEQNFINWEKLSVKVWGNEGHQVLTNSSQQDFSTPKNLSSFSFQTSQNKARWQVLIEGELKWLVDQKENSKQLIGIYHNNSWTKIKQKHCFLAKKTRFNPLGTSRFRHFYSSKLNLVLKRSILLSQIKNYKKENRSLQQENLVTLDYNNVPVSLNSSFFVQNLPLITDSEETKFIQKKGQFANLGFQKSSPSFINRSHEKKQLLILAQALFKNLCLVSCQDFNLLKSKLKQKNKNFSLAFSRRSKVKTVNQIDLLNCFSNSLLIPIRFISLLKFDKDKFSVDQKNINFEKSSQVTRSFFDVKSFDKKIGNWPSYLFLPVQPKIKPFSKQIIASPFWLQLNSILINQNYGKVKKERNYEIIQLEFGPIFSLTSDSKYSTKLHEIKTKQSNDSKVIVKPGSKVSLTPFQKKTSLRSSFVKIIDLQRLEAPSLLNQSLLKTKGFGPLVPFDNQDMWSEDQFIDFKEELKEKIRLRKPSLVNNYYVISSFFRWTKPEKPGDFLKYIAPVATKKDRLIPVYLARGLTFDIQSTGAGWLKHLLDLLFEWGEFKEKTLSQNQLLSHRPIFPLLLQKKKGDSDRKQNLQKKLFPIDFKIYKIQKRCYKDLYLFKPSSLEVLKDEERNMSWLPEILDDVKTDIVEFPLKNWNKINTKRIETRLLKEMGKGLQTGFQKSTERQTFETRIQSLVDLKENEKQDLLTPFDFKRSETNSPLSFDYFEKVAKNYKQKSKDRLLILNDLEKNLSQWTLYYRNVYLTQSLDSSRLRFPKSHSDYIVSQSIKRKISKLFSIQKRVNRRLKILFAFSKNRGNLVGDSMILDVLPVLPPSLRPIIALDSEQIAVSDLNKLYQTILFRNQRFQPLSPYLEPLFPSLIQSYSQRLLQEGVNALIENGKGNTPPISASNGRPLKSLTDMIKGKQGRFRQNLLGKRVDYSGRSVIIVGPQLKLHECGLPREMALELFQPFLIRSLFLRGAAPNFVKAKQLIKLKTERMLDILQEVMANRPVLLNRAPTLHRLGIQAFQPKLVSGQAILLHPLVCSAFNADFDGDQMAVHVPISPEACAEAWKLMGSRNNILSPATGDPIIVPSQDMVLGCYYLTSTDRIRIKKNLNSASYLFPFLSLNSTPYFQFYFGTRQSNELENRNQKTLETGLDTSLYKGNKFLFVLFPVSLDFLNKGKENSDLKRKTLPFVFPRKTEVKTIKTQEEILKKTSLFEDLIDFENKSTVKNFYFVLNRFCFETHKLKNLISSGIEEKDKNQNRIKSVQPSGLEDYFSNWNSVSESFHQQLIHLHSIIWLRWPFYFEFGLKQERFLEIRLDKFGNNVSINRYYQLHSNSQFLFDKPIIYLRTTVGRVLMNQLIFETFNRPFLKKKNISKFEKKLIRKTSNKKKPF